MSVYGVSRLCRDILHDDRLRERLASNASEVFDEFKLSGDERNAMLRGDVGTLYDMGVNPFLLGNLPRFGLFGLTNRIYNSRIRKEA